MQKPLLTIILCLLVVLPTVLLAVDICPIEKLPTQITINHARHPRNLALGQLTNSISISTKLVSISRETGVSSPLANKEILFEITLAGRFLVRNSDGSFILSDSPSPFPLNTSEDGTVNISISTERQLMGNSTDPRKLAYVITASFAPGTREPLLGSAKTVRYTPGVYPILSLSACMPLFMVAALLVAAMFAAGQNPFGLLDFSRVAFRAPGMRRRAVRTTGFSPFKAIGAEKSIKEKVAAPLMRGIYKSAGFLLSGNKALGGIGASDKGISGKLGLGAIGRMGGVGGMIMSLGKTLTGQGAAKGTGAAGAAAAPKSGAATTAGKGILKGLGYVIGGGLLMAGGAAKVAGGSLGARADTMGAKRLTKEQLENKAKALAAGNEEKLQQQRVKAGLEIGKFDTSKGTLKGLGTLAADTGRRIGVGLGLSPGAYDKEKPGFKDILKDIAGLKALHLGGAFKLWGIGTQSAGGSMAAAETLIGSWQMTSGVKQAMIAQLVATSKGKITAEELLNGPKDAKGKSTGAYIDKNGLTEEGRKLIGSRFGLSTRFEAGAFAAAGIDKPSEEARKAVAKFFSGEITIKELKAQLGSGEGMNKLYDAVKGQNQEYSNWLITEKGMMTEIGERGSHAKYEEKAFQEAGITEPNKGMKSAVSDYLDGRAGHATEEELKEGLTKANAKLPEEKRLSSDQIDALMNAAREQNTAYGLTAISNIGLPKLSADELVTAGAGKGALDFAAYQANSNGTQAHDRAVFSSIVDPEIFDLAMKGGHENAEKVKDMISRIQNEDERNAAIMLLGPSLYIEARKIGTVDECNRLISGDMKTQELRNIIIDGTALTSIIPASQLQSMSPDEVKQTVDNLRTNFDDAFDSVKTQRDNTQERMNAESRSDSQGRPVFTEKYEDARTDYERANQRYENLEGIKEQTDRFEGIRELRDGIKEMTGRDVLDVNNFHDSATALKAAEVGLIDNAVTELRNKTGVNAEEANARLQENNNEMEKLRNIIGPSVGPSARIGHEEEREMLRDLEKQNRAINEYRSVAGNAPDVAYAVGNGVSEERRSEFSEVMKGIESSVIDASLRSNGVTPSRELQAQANAQRVNTKEWIEGTGAEARGVTVAKRGEPSQITVKQQ